MSYKIVSPADLPWPHNPFKCGLRNDLLTHYPAFDDLDDDAKQEAFAEFVASRRPDEFAGCSYHDALRPRAASFAVELFSAGDIDVENHWELEAALAEQPREIIGMVSDFFGLDAIRWDGHTQQLTNGQHRVCALKTANAPLCVISTPD